jgi:hypothetical protein
VARLLICRPVTPEVAGSSGCRLFVFALQIDVFWYSFALRGERRRAGSLAGELEAEIEGQVAHEVFGVLAAVG